MAGRPRQRALKQQLQAYADGMALPDGLAFVCAWLEDGRTMLQLQERLKFDTAQDFHQHSIRRQLERDYGKEKVLAAFGEARAEGAHAKVEEAQQIIDTAPLDRDGIAKAREQASIRLWQAERANKSAYGGNKPGDVNVNVSLGQLHIDALRSRVVQAKAEIAEVVEVKQLTDGGDDE